MGRIVQLEWARFAGFIEARNAFADVSCVYIQADAEGNPLRVGKASKGLQTRYRGGTGYALDAAMHHSGNLFFAASVVEGDCATVEDELIWEHRERLIYNNIGKKTEPAIRLELLHSGDSPAFD